MYQALFQLLFLIPRCHKRLNLLKETIFLHFVCRWFWISWANDILSVGSGLDVGTGAFMEYREGGLNHTTKAATLYGGDDPVTFHVRNVDGNN